MLWTLKEESWARGDAERQGHERARPLCGEPSQHGRQARRRTSGVRRGVGVAGSHPPVLAYVYPRVRRGAPIDLVIGHCQTYKSIMQ